MRMWVCGYDESKEVSLESIGGRYTLHFLSSLGMGEKNNEIKGLFRCSFGGVRIAEVGSFVRGSMRSVMGVNGTRFVRMM